MSSNNASIAKLIDHALLHPTMTDDEIRSGCKMARRLGVASVCVKPYAINIAVQELQGSDVKVGTVIGFPQGSNPTEIKVAEADWCCRAGATEFDMVINVGKALQGDWDYVEAEVTAVSRMAKEHGALLKVIFETGFVSEPDSIVRLCQISERAGVDFVKTSTGFGFVKGSDGELCSTGATEEHIRLMRETCSERVGVKASGGIRNLEDAEKFRALGATRLGTSSTESIVAGESVPDASY